MARAGFYARYHSPRLTKKSSRQDGDTPRTINDSRGQHERLSNVSRTLEYQWFSKARRYAMDGILLARFSRVHLFGGRWGCFLWQAIKRALVHVIGDI